MRDISKNQGEWETNSSVPARNLGSDLHPSELNVVAFACSQPSALNGVDDGACGGIADNTAGLPVLICAPGEVIRMAVEDGVSANNIRGQGRKNVQFSILDERVGRRIGCHLEFSVPEVKGRSI